MSLFEVKVKQTATRTGVGNQEAETLQDAIKLAKENPKFAPTWSEWSDEGETEYEGDEQKQLNTGEPGTPAAQGQTEQEPEKTLDTGGTPTHQYSWQSHVGQRTPAGNTVGEAANADAPRVTTSDSDTRPGAPGAATGDAPTPPPETDTPAVEPSTGSEPRDKNV